MAPACVLRSRVPSTNRSADFCTQTSGSLSSQRPPTPRVFTTLLSVALACSVGGCASAPIAVVPTVAVTPPPGFVCTASERDGYVEYVDIGTCSAAGDVRDVVQLVARAVRAEHLFEGYDSIWAEGAAGRTVSRPQAPSACDVTLAPEAARRRLGVVFEDYEAGSLEVGLTRVEGVVRDDTATVRAEVEVQAGYGEDTGHYVHEYELRRSGALWGVHHVRLWAVDWAIPDESETYDAAFWAQLDAAAERAGEARAGLTGDALLEAQRAYAAALQQALCPRQAYAVLSDVVTARGAHAADWLMLADAALDLGLFDEAESASARARVVPLGPPTARTLLGCWNHASTCPADDPDGGDDEDCLPRELCDVDVLGRVDVPSSGDARALALVRERRDEQGAESVYLLFGAAGAWTSAILLEEGPRHDGQQGGVRALTVEAPQLAALGPATSTEGSAPDGLTLRYELREREVGESGAVDVVERGVLACQGLDDDLRCERLPDFVERQPEGGRARQASATLTFPGDGTVVVRATRGRDVRIVVGQRPIIAPPTP